MKSKLIIVICIIIAIAIRTTNVQGLQCYVCEDCNEYEDFKELQICGELTIITTQRPNTMTDSVVTNPTTPTITFNASATTLKPPGQNDTDDYMYDYSMESNDDTGISTNKQLGNRNRTKTTVGVVVTTITTTFPTLLNASNQDGNLTTIVPTTLPAGNTVTNTSQISMTTLKSVQQPQDNDYLEYEDPKMFNVNHLPKAAATGSLSKINEPVCYMFRYHANNTIFTKRGCTTSINDNTYLTCQSLYNGQPISGCRICNTDGCNKYAYDESGEDQLYNAGVMNQLSIFVISMLAIVTSVIN